MEDFWAKMGESVIEDIMQEFNHRTKLELPLRFELIDDVGQKVRGHAQTEEDLVQAAFQDALMGISHSEFEQLSARILEWAGCTSFWSTPQSHDEGLDAFGLMHLDFPNPRDPDARLPAVSMLAQAKHYLKEKVRTGHVREFVGSGVLAKYGIYSTAADKYTELEMRPFAPIAFFLVSSGEVTRTARGLARRAGVFLLTSQDIFRLCQRHWERKGVPIPDSVASMKRLLKRELRGIPVTV